MDVLPPCNRSTKHSFYDRPVHLDMYFGPVTYLWIFPRTMTDLLIYRYFGNTRYASWHFHAVPTRVRIVLVVFFSMAVVHRACICGDKSRGPTAKASNRLEPTVP